MLTAKQKRFAVEYPIDLNATQAALRAGYSEKVARKQGCINLTNPDIAALIQEQANKVAKKCEISQEWVLERLKDIADKCSLSQEPTWNPAGANKALELLGKHLGMFVDKSEVDHAGQIRIVYENGEPSGASRGSKDS